MDVVIIPRDARLSRHENALVVTSDAGRKSIPLNGVKHVLCMGNGSISIHLLKDMGRRGIRFSVLDAGGRFLGAFEPEEETPSGRVRIGQAKLFLDEGERLRIAKAIVSAHEFIHAGSPLYAGHSTLNAVQRCFQAEGSVATVALQQTAH